MTYLNIWFPFIKKGFHDFIVKYLLKYFPNKYGVYLSMNNTTISPYFYL